MSAGRHESPGAAVALRAVAKRFGGIVALAGVDLDVEAGSIHALVGENGAGKSTCLGLLAGRVAPTGGEIRVFGAPLAPGSPRRSRRAGIAAIYQELTIVPRSSALANVFLGQDPSRWGLVRRRAMRRRYRELCATVGAEIPPDVPAGTLSVAQQQLLEIMRALVGGPRLLLFDEPTAALGPREREALYRVIRRLNGAGATILFVSHNLDEVLDLADAVTVFRNGAIAGAGPVAAWTKARLVHAMVGRELEQLREHRAAPARPSQGTPVLRVAGLHVPGALHDVALELRAGEVLGIGGLVGSGRSTLLRAIGGDVPAASGRIWIDGRARAWPASVRRARAEGIALMPEDRATAGILKQLDAAGNVVISDLARASRLGVVSRSRMRALAAEVAADVGFAPARLGAAAGTLSGGNQQKLLLARCAHARPRVLLADEPTRGVDVGAKAEIMRTLERMAAAGTAIVVVSSELEDLQALCGRVVVLAGGRVAGEIARGADATPRAILDLAFGVEEARR